MKIKRKISIFCLCLIFFLSCNNENSFVIINKRVNNCLQDKKNAIDVLEKTFEDKRIVLIGCSNHSTMNDILFFSEENLKRLYDKGLRFILCEGGLEDKFVYDKSDLEKKYVTLFYPWESVGSLYCPYTLHDTVLKINSSLPDQDKIQIIGLEGCRKEFIESEEKEENIMNYRDKYMFDIAQQFIDNENENKKFLILCGAFHGSNKEIKENGETLYPLATYMNKKYKNDFETFNYISLSSFIIESMYYKEFLENQNWYENDYKQKYILFKDIKKINRDIPIFVDDSIKNYSNFFVDKNSIYGIKYGYVFDKDFVLKEVIKQIQDSNYKLSNNLINLNKMEAEDYYKIEDFIINIYYLKLFYGDTFDYDFWNPKTTLENAISNLPNSFSRKRVFTNQELEEYQNLLNVMYYICFSTSKKRGVMYYNYGKDLIERARLIFPDEVWFDYWHAKMNYIIEDYTTSLEYCNKLLDNKLITCSQIFPEILDLAIENSKKLNLDFSDYEIAKKSLKNEFNIDISLFPLLK